MSAKRLLESELRHFGAERDRALLFFFQPYRSTASHAVPRGGSDRSAASRPTPRPISPTRCATTYIGDRRTSRPRDEPVGENTAIVVMSDHGFSSFRHQVHLNRWLELRGYLRLTDSFNRNQLSSGCRESTGQRRAHSRSA